jgi:hypothetical protein
MKKLKHVYGFGEAAHQPKVRSMIASDDDTWALSYVIDNNIGAVCVFRTKWSYEMLERAVDRYSQVMPSTYLSATQSASRRSQAGLMPPLHPHEAVTEMCISMIFGV